MSDIRTSLDPDPSTLVDEVIPGQLGIETLGEAGEHTSPQIELDPISGDPIPEGERIVFGGYAAKQCVELARKDGSAFYDPELKLPFDDAVRARMEDGNVFEAEVIGQLRSTRSQAVTEGAAVFLEGDRTPESLAAREAATLEAMLNGAGDITNGRFSPQVRTHRAGEPDQLRLAGKNALGNHAYYPGDYKHHKELSGVGSEKIWRVSELTDLSFEGSSELTLRGTTKIEDDLQLAHYHRMLQTIGHAVDGEAWGFIIGKSRRAVWRRLDVPVHQHVDTTGVRRRMSALEIYDQELALRVAVRRRENAREFDENLEPLSRPELKAECKECPWRVVCHDELVEADDITLLQGLTPARARAYRKKGINTASQLTRLDYPTAVAVDLKLDVPSILTEAKVAPDTTAAAATILAAHLPKGKKLAEVAAALAAVGVTTVADLAALDARTAQLAGGELSLLPQSIDQARVVKVGKVHLARGKELVSFKRASIELDIDFEDMPGHTYMFGVLASGRKKVGDNIRLRSEYHCFATWDGTDEGEAQAFAEFWAYLQFMIAKAKVNRYGIRMYHYTQHEVHAMRGLAVKHLGVPGVPTPEEVEALVTSDTWVDLYPILSQEMVWPTEDATIKSLAKWVRHSWTEDGANGAQSIAWYQAAIHDPDEAVREQMRERLRIYNRDDNVATLKVRDWISQLGETRRPGDRIPHVSVLDARFRRRPLRR